MMRILLLLWMALTAVTFSPHSLASEARILSEFDIEQLHGGEVISEIWRDKSRSDKALTAYAAVDIKATPQQIWSIMTSCQSSVDIVKEMTSCTIMETSPDGDWDIREQRFRAPFPLGSFRTEFKTTFTPHHKMTIQRSGGDMKVQDAVWTITALEPGQSRVTYQASVALKIPVPRFMLRRALRKDTPELMENLRRAAEELSGSALSNHSAEANL